MLRRSYLFVGIVVLLLFATLIVSMFITNPDELGPFGLTLWFSTLLTATTGLLWIILTSFIYGKSREGMMIALRRSFLISMWAVAILALSSLRQLGIRDIILLTVLGLLIDFYMKRVQK